MAVAEIAAASNPWGAAIGGAASLLGGALGGSVGPSSADAIFGTNLQFDNSGWNVAFKGSTIDSKSEKTASQATPGSMGAKGSDYTQLVLIFVGGLIALKALKAMK